jgi:hypothetical protein
MPPDKRTRVETGPAEASPLAFAMAENDRRTLAMVRDALQARRLRLAWQPVVLGRDTDRTAYFEGRARPFGPGDPRARLHARGRGA